MTYATNYSYLPSKALALISARSITVATAKVAIEVEKSGFIGINLVMAIKVKLLNYAVVEECENDRK